MKLSKFSQYAQAAAQASQFEAIRSRAQGSSILVTGGTGLVGQAFVKVLDAYVHDADAHLYLSVRNKERAAAQFADLRTQNVHFIGFGDVEELVAQGVKFTHIVHLASPATPHDFNKHTLDVLETNVIQTRFLLDIAAAQSAHFILASTLEIYGNVAPTSDSEDLYLTEDMQGVIDNVNPRAIYPESKRLAENLCSIHSNMNSGLASVARISHTFGPGFAATDDRVQNQFIRKATSGDNIVLQSDGSLRRTYTYSLDVGTALAAIMFRENAQEFAAYNISAMENMISIRQLAEITLEAANRSPEDLVFDLPEGTQMWSGNRGGLIPDTTKIATIGWSAQYDVLKGLQETIDSFLND